MRLVKCVFSINVRTTFAKNFFFLALCSCTSGVLICGDVELSPGPRKTKSCYNFSSCNCNLNSITTYNFSKTPVLEMYNSQHKFDICIFFFFSIRTKKKNICISETSRFKFPDDHPRFNIPRRMVRADIFCACLKESFTVRPVACPYLKECLLLEVFIQSKKVYLVSLYRSPSQT